MSEYLDENRISAILAISNDDGETILPVYGNPANHSLKVDDTGGGSDNGTPTYMKDDNRRVAFYAVSAVDGETPVAVYVDSATNQLLITTT